MEKTNECPVRINSIEWLKTITNYMKDKGIIPKESSIEVFDVTGVQTFFSEFGPCDTNYNAYLEYISSQGFQAFKWNYNYEGVMKAYEFLQSLQKIEAGEITYFSIKIYVDYCNLN